MIQLELSEPEGDFLADIIAIWLEGYEEAGKATHSDPTFESVDEFLMVTTGLEDQQKMAEDIRDRLKKATFHV